jgi:hypothetical protein
MTTSVSQDDALRKLDILIEHLWGRALVMTSDDFKSDKSYLLAQKNYLNYSKMELVSIIAKARLEAAIGELDHMSIEVVEPCEPDCDAVRHALHQGSWDAHLTIDERIKQLTEELTAL